MSAAYTTDGIAFFNLFLLLIHGIRVLDLTKWPSSLCSEHGAHEIDYQDTPRTSTQVMACIGRHCFRTGA